MIDPLVSIIIPTYNRAHLIGETLDSIIAQTYTNWECIVVDDGSTDNTSNVLKEYLRRDKRICYYERPKGRLPGGNAARNYGFELCNGKYVNWFDSDDVMLPSKIAKHIEMFIKSPNIDATITNSYLYNFKTKNAYLPWRQKQFTNDLLNDFISLKAGWQTGDGLWARESLAELAFNEELKSSQDWEFHLKAILLDFKFVFDNQCFSYIRHTPNSIKNTSDKNKYLSQFLSRRNILEFNEKYKKINNKGYFYIFEELFFYFRFFLLNKEYKRAIESFKWMVIIALRTRKVNHLFNNIILKRFLNKQ